VASNILSNEPRGPVFVQEPINFRPEVAVIFRALALPGDTKGLAWVSPANNVNGIWPFSSGEFSHIVINLRVRPFPPVNVVEFFFDLAERDGLKSTRPLKAKGEAADAAEKIKDF
jgi:hypothetical protein